MADREKMLQLLAEAKARSAKADAAGERPGDNRTGQYLMQRAGRGAADLAGGAGDFVNLLANAGIRDVDYFTGGGLSGGSYDPFQFGAPSQDIADIATDATGADIVPRDEMSKGVQRGGDALQMGIGSIPNGPEDLAMPLMHAGVALGIGSKLGREGLTAAKAAPDLAKAGSKIDGTVGDLNNAPALSAEGIDPRTFTSTEQWHKFGLEHGVDNLGSASEADWQKSLAPFTTSQGVDFTVPGGVDTKDPFTYFDLLHLKQQGINPNDIPPELHQGIHDRMLATMSPEGEVSPERMMNQLLLAQISPNQPLTPNELAVARGMMKGPEDLQKLGDMLPWRYNDDPAKTGASDIMSSKPAIDKKTGKPKLDKNGNPAMIHTTRRQQLSSEIANKLGLGAGSAGGLGARGTADYTRIAETAQRMREDPEFFKFRGAGEGGGLDEHDPANWSNFVERLANQTPGLSSKTGSFGAVWQNPQAANISAVDRHMAGKFTEEMFPSTEDYHAFRDKAVALYAKNTGKPVAGWEQLPQSFKNDQMFGYLNSNPNMQYRGKPAKGSNSGEGAVNPRVPDHLQPDQAQWVDEPKKIDLISEPYRRVLAANAEEANAAGQSIFGSQWMLWDRIRNRLEPHEIMFPGLEKLPRMSMDQMQAARADLSGAGYMSGTKTVDELTGEPTGLQPVRKLPSASRAAYFTLPPALLGGGMLQMMEERDRENRMTNGRQET